MEYKILSREQILENFGKLKEKLPEDRLEKRMASPQWNPDTKQFERKELTYVPIYVTIEELDKKFGMQWSCENVSLALKEVRYSWMEDDLDEEGNLVWIKIKGKNKPRKKKMEAIETAMFCTLDMVIRDETGKELCRRPGFGAGTNRQKTLNADMMAKTALANALRKGANNYGLGLYLWHGDESIPETEDSSEDASSDASKNTIEFTDDNKEKIRKLKKELGLSGDEMSAYLKKCFPTSKGNISFLKLDDENGNQDKKVKKFVEETVEEAKKAVEDE